MARMRVVQPDESPPKPAEPLTVTAAAKQGTHRELLVALRDRVALAVESKDTNPRELAALTRSLRDIAKEIEQIDLREREEGADAADLQGDQALDASAF